MKGLEVLGDDLQLEEVKEKVDLLKRVSAFSSGSRRVASFSSSSSSAFKSSTVRNEFIRKVLEGNIIWCE